MCLRLNGGLPMFEEANARLVELKENMRNKAKWELRVKQLEQELAEHEQEMNRWRERLTEEERDVEKLTGNSLSGFFYGFIGRKEEKLEREQLEVMEAKAKYDAAVRAVEDIRGQRNETQALLQEVRYSDFEYERILEEKERYILQHNDELAALAEQQADLSVQLKEMKEAVQAGRSVLEDLKQAEESLSSARNWGTYDMLGGGMISTHIKHNRVDEAMGYIHDAQSSLRRFGKELRDVQVALDVEIDIGSFLKFSDYFFDGFISDWLVQGRIKDTLAEVQDKRSDVTQIVRRLQTEYSRLESQIADTKRKYDSLIELAQ